MSSDDGFREVDETQFLSVMASFPAGVAVVTSLDQDERPVGLTISAFCSVSRTPPLILICVDKGSATLPAIQHSQKFTVNFLSEGREPIAQNFATKDPDKFAAQAWRHSEGLPGGGPVLHEDTVAYLVCTVYEAVEAGDHWVFIGEVVEANVEEEARSLLYHRRNFSSIG
ncbi:MAG TPA: flavin reductase family protein [Solirubrobacterales bacterium]|jgi:flavin reductase (DIM6/NTAB) family NADH-FMN oxidoreductase RutF|nr:flavin reductase family protein [Solirubrobacterales bacterium]